MAAVFWDQRYVDAPVLRWRDTGGDPDLDETLYFCNDANMNVTALVNASGTVVERYVYDAYGDPTVLEADWSADANNTSDFGNEILYCGYRRSAETGLYAADARVYHPTLGRWVQRDPAGAIDGANLYQYVSGNPARYTDPLGSSGDSLLNWLDRAAAGG